jgi:hypothetical protein
MTQAAAAAEQQQASSSSSGSEAAADNSSSDAGTSAADGDAPTAAAAAEATSSSSSSSSSYNSAEYLEQQQQQLREFFGPKTLNMLAGKTAQMCSSMTERELGQVLASVSAVKYTNNDLLSAAAAAFEAMCAAGTPTAETLLSAAWAGASLRFPKPSLLQPALVAAAADPGSIDGVGAGRLMRITSWLTPEEVEQQRSLLLQELHRRSGARGAAPSVPAAAADDGSSSSSSSNAEWVTALADNLADRMGSLKPREVANLVAAFAAIPGVELHEGLFTAAAAHIETHAHTFTRFAEMEMVASAFEKMNFKQGLGALKALHQQAEHLAASKF